MKTQQLRRMMVLANDPKEHDVCFSTMGKGWLFENANHGLVSIHETFAEAIAAMAEATGGYHSGYEWTVTDNPYN